MKKIITSKSGAALLAVLILIAVASVLAAALYAYASYSYSRYLTAADRAQSEYLARAGIEATVPAWLEAGGSELEMETLPVYAAADGRFITAGGDSESVPEDYIGFYIVSITPNYEMKVGGAAYVVMFDSVGTVNGVSATVSAYLEYSTEGYASKWIYIDTTLN